MQTLHETYTSPSTIKTLSQTPLNSPTLTMADQHRHKNTKNSATSSSAVDDEASSGTAFQGPTGTPCGACKFLRRKCVSGCVFAQHFGSDQGSTRFAAVHKVFGASNVSKLLLHIPMNRRNDAVATICYEAQSRLSDPVYGCVSTIFALQQQVASLQAELAIAQNRIMNSRIVAASVLPQQQQQQQQIPLLQHTYSNNSSASTNLLNMNSFNSNFDFTNETALLQLSLPCQRGDHEAEEESGNQLVSFANQIILHH